MDPVPLLALVTLALGATGDLVSNLHQLLLRFGGVELPDDELGGGVYGPGTRRAVEELQEQMGLQPPVPGDVDAATAEALNERAFEEEMFAVVDGHVGRNDGTPVAGATVEVRDAANEGGLTCATTTTDDAGRYRAFYDPRFYARERPGVVVPTERVTVVVRARDADGAETTSDPVAEPQRRLTVDLTLPGAPGRLLRVRGIVVDDLAAPVAGLRVEALDREVGPSRQSLGKAVTNEAGAFEVAYDPALSRPAEGPGRRGAAADVLVEVRTAGDEALVVRSVERLAVPGEGDVGDLGMVDPRVLLLGIPARDDELVRITVPAAEPDGPSLFERLLEQLGPLTRVLPLERFDEEATQDVSFAARELDVPVDLVADLVTAHVLALVSFEGRFAPADLFGLIRTVGVRDVRSLATRSRTELAAGLVHAVDARVIPRSDADPGTTAGAIHAAAVRLALAGADADAGAVERVLSTVVADPARRADLVTASVDFDGDADAFWSGVEQTDPDLPVADIRFRLQLAGVADGAVELVEAITQDLPDVHDMRRLALELDDERLGRLVEASGARPATQLDAEAPEQAQARLRRDTSRLLAVTQPTSVVARRARAWSHGDAPVVPVTAALFLERAVRDTDFDLDTGDVAALAVERADVLFDEAASADDRRRTVEAVQRVQRLYRVSTDPEVMHALVTVAAPAGGHLTGAADIARYSRSAFLAGFGQESARVRAGLEQVHDRSRAMVDTLSTLMVAAHQDVSDTMPQAVRAAAPVDGATPGGVPAGGAGQHDAGIASWTDLFGGAEQCECGECRSITGPAAYLVDLFEYLDKRCRADERGVTPLDHLIGHPTRTAANGDDHPIAGLRPDLAHIKLTCANVETTVPTIDLINEILESSVAFGQPTPLLLGPDGEPVQPAVLRPNEPSPGVTGRQLSAAPEHVIERAYRLLSRAVYPMVLPYDRLLTTARVHLAQVGTSRADLLELFGPGPSTLPVAADRLGLLARDVEILTGRSLDGAPTAEPVPTEALFGFEAGEAGWTDRLAASRTALTRLGVSFGELVELLRMRVVGGMVPDAEEGGTASHLLLDVDQLTVLRSAGYVVEAGSAIEEALDRGGLTADDVRGFVDGFGAALGATVVLDPPPSCDPDEIRLRHLDGTELAEGEWLRLHRLVRLSRRTGIPLSDLDTALTAVGVPSTAGAADDLDAPTLVRLAVLARLRQTEEVTWAQVAALVGDIPTHGPDNLYDELFVRSGLARTQPALRRAPDGRVLGDGMPLTDAMPALGSALDVDLAELRAIAASSGLGVLSLPAVSQLFRTSVLARLLGVTPSDCALLCTLLPPAAPVAGAASDVVDLLARARRLLGAGLTPDVLSRLTAVTAPGAAPAPATGTEHAGVLGALAAAGAAADARDQREAAEEAEAARTGTGLPPATVASRADARRADRLRAASDVVADAFSLDGDVVRGVLAARPQTLLLTDLGDLAVPQGPDGPAGGVDPARRGEALAILAGFARLATVADATGVAWRRLRPALTTSGRTADSAAATLFDGSDAAAAVAVVEDVARFTALAEQTCRPQALADAVVALAAAAEPAWPPAARAAAAAWATAPVAEVESLLALGHPALDGVEAARHPLVALDHLRTCLRHAARLGRPVAEVPALLDEPIGSDALDALVKGVAAGYPASSWPEVSRQLADPVRERSRDALVAYLVHRDGLTGPDQLFDTCLIDTRISSFALTSRIRQAIFAVHTYVQRCQLGLVRGVRPDQIDTAEWEGMASQPVWTARLEAMLRPEWLLEPSWRDNKTRLFKDAEKTLRQSDVTPGSVLEVYDRYLADLGDIAALEVCGTFLQTVFTGQEEGRYRSVLHVVGRTRSSVPRRYFYRRLNQHVHYREWTDWEPVPVDIQGVEQDRTGLRNENQAAELIEPGVQVLPVVWRDQVHLFWPTFVRKVEGKDAPPAVDTSRPTITASFARPYWEIKLCWTRRDTTAWSPKEQSTALVETWWKDAVRIAGRGTFYTGPKLPDPNEVVLQARLDPDRQLALVVGERQPDGSVGARCEFSFDRAAGEMRVGPVLRELSGDHPPFAAATLTGSYLGLRAEGGVRVVPAPEKPRGDLLCTPLAPLRVLTLNQGYGAPLQAPYFLDLGDGACFATAEPSASTFARLVAKPDSSMLTGPHRVGQYLEQAAAAAMTTGPTVSTWTTYQAAAASAAALPVLQSSITSKAAQTIAAVGLTAGVADQVAGPELVYLPIHFPEWTWATVPSVHLTVTPFSHPLVDRFRAILRREGLHALLSPATQRLTVPTADTLAARLRPEPQRMTVPAVEGVDFAPGSPFGTENAELFFFLPGLMTALLTENKQYSAAMRMQAVFYDPLGGGATPEDAWTYLPLREAKAVRLDELLSTTALPPGDPARVAFEAQIEAMRLYPFQAHRIARLRPLAYKKWAVIQAVKLQLAISRDHHAQFPNPEAFNRAFQPALLASALLGPRPQTLRPRVSMAPRSYAELRPDLDGLGNVLLTAETALGPVATAALDLAVPHAGGPGTGQAAEPTAAAVQRAAMGYFGIPPDHKLLALWDEVDDRLFKLRNSMDLNGVQSQLPLFPPRIDPAVLAEAIAGGMTLAGALAALSAPRPPQRFEHAHAEAVTDAERLVTLGEALLATAAGRDEHALARLRSTHDVALARLVLDTRRKQLDAARGELTEVLGQRRGLLEQWEHFRDLLGLPDMPAPSLSPYAPGTTHPSRPLNLVPSEKVSFEDLRVIPGLAIGLLNSAPPTRVAGAVAGAVDAGAAGMTMAPGMILAEEEQELQESFAAVRLSFDAALLDTLAGVVGLIPNFEGAVKPFGAGAAVHFGGQALAAVARAAAGNKNTAAGMHRFLAQVYAKQANVVLREREWVAGLNRAAAAVREVDQRALTMNLNIAYRQAELDAQVASVTHAEQIETFLRDSFTRTEIYAWKVDRLRELFRRACDVAFESALAADASFRAQREPGNPHSFVTVQPPRDAREELMTGHALLTCLQEMRRTFHATEPAGPHVVRQFSLRDVDPWALYYLREEGKATFSLPEVVFDIDHPGHYDRRIRRVRVSVLCTTGPTVGVTGTLTLTGSRRRRGPVAAGAPEEDTAGPESIALSTGRDDAGYFGDADEPHLFRPFEGRGAVSDWQLTLPAEFRKMNYREIANVVMTVEYKAKDAGLPFAQARTALIRQALNALTRPGGAGPDAGPYRLVSLRHDCPDAWAAFRAGQPLDVAVVPEMLPYFLRDRSMPTLEDAVAFPLPTARPAGDPVVLATGGAGPWSLALPDPDALGDPARTDDVALLLHFAL
ncbi:Tc toxin subunit A-related protein [Geodermatophilus chilensis]|uniref:Tc toxin subunit A-related protein n=1 Tax=Geodermatophilus chilensis TaxID=2035835 RepID=UPI0018E40D2D|nr:neuraminidase-like domain-containing protein [Geodermatophilus chilensis]